MPQLTITINLTDIELEAFNLIASLYEESQAESAESYVKDGIEFWIHTDAVIQTPKARRLAEALEKEQEEAKKQESQKASEAAVKEEA